MLAPFTNDQANFRYMVDSIDIFRDGGAARRDELA
jgi:hypothetical protein